MTSQPLPPIPEQVRTTHFKWAQSQPALSARISGASPALVLQEQVQTWEMPKLTMLLPNGTWTPVVQAREITAHRDTVVATSTAQHFPNIAPLQAAVLTANGWAPTPPSGLNNLSEAGLALTGHELVIIGGWSAHVPQPGEEPPVEATESDTPPPYVTEVQDSIWKLNLDQ